MASVAVALSGDEPEHAGVVRVAVAGDMMFDRGVRDAADQHGAAWLFSGYAAPLIGADLTIGNLECPVARGGAPLGVKNSFNCGGWAPGALAEAGFDAVSLANNHALDLGAEGYSETVAALGAAGVGAFGLPRGGGGGEVVLERNGVRVALLGFNVFGGGVDAASVRSAVEDAREGADAVIVYFHWGNEYSGRVSGAQSGLARAAMQGGAVLVAGAHPHVLQRASREGGALVAYSLGNFIFDHTRGDAYKTALLVADISPRGVEGYRFLPGEIRGGRPVPVSGTIGEKILKTLGVTE